MEEKNNKERWNKYWNENNTPWHVNGYHPRLLKHSSMLIKEEDKNKNKRVLVPLAGKTKDMIYFLKAGFDVGLFDSNLEVNIPGTRR